MPGAGCRESATMPPPSRLGNKRKLSQNINVERYIDRTIDKHYVSKTYDNIRMPLDNIDRQHRLESRQHRLVLPSLKLTKFKNTPYYKVNSNHR